MAERTCTGFVISVNQRVVQNLNIEKEMEQRFREVMLKIDETEITVDLCYLQGIYAIYNSLL